MFEKSTSCGTVTPIIHIPAMATFALQRELNNCEGAAADPSLKPLLSRPLAHQSLLFQKMLSK